MSTIKRIFGKIFWCFHSFNERNWIYKVVSLVGLIIRAAILPTIFPNIFETLAEFFIGKLGLPSLLYKILLFLALIVIDNFSLLNFFYIFSFATVGISYRRGSAPVWGSICYSLYYTAYWIIPIILFLYFKWWVILITFGGYLALCAAINAISYFLDTLPSLWFIFLCIQGFFAIIIFVALLLICLLYF